MSTKNFAILLVSVAFSYLGIMLYQVCKGDFSDNHCQDDDEYYQMGSQYEYGTEYEQEYTNSQYCKSDGENSFLSRHYAQNKSLLDTKSDVSSQIPKASHREKYRRNTIKIADFVPAKNVHASPILPKRVPNECKEQGHYHNDKCADSG